MKSFTSTSFASDYAEHLQRAQAAVNEHPQALFTDFQWFLFAGKDTVFFTAGSKIAFDKDTIGNLVADMVALAPQLTLASSAPGPASRSPSISSTPSPISGSSIASMAIPTNG